MTLDRRRYGRQIRLADVGEAGQAKLCAAHVVLGGAGFARDIEERYVRAAGMNVVAPEDAGAPARARAVEVDVTALGFRHESTREVAEGALRALVAIRAALGGAS